MKDFFERHEKRLQRPLEILPGFMAWMVIIFPFWGSIFFPQFVAYIVLIFMAFWLYRSIVMGSLAVKGYFKIKEYKKIDWKEKYEKVKDDLEYTWEEITHVVIISTYNETVDVLRRPLQSLADQKYAKDQIIVVLAIEERARDHKERSQILLGEFQKYFKVMYVSVHPKDIPGEIKGKASNERWAAIGAKKKLVGEMGYDLEKITVTSVDADAKFDPNYFSCLTFKFIENPNRYLRFWQAPIFEHNNIEEVPALIRIVSIMGGTYLLSDLQEPRKLFINYSAYSTSMKLLEDTGYWDPDIIPEDWHIFLKSFFALKGEVEVVPIFLPISIDAAQAKTYVGSLINRYEQTQRHAWGVTLVPYTIKQFFIHPEIPLTVRALRVFKVFESHLLWGVSWFFVTLAATVPPLVNPAFEQTVLGQNLPRLTSSILTLSLATLLITIAIDAKLRPPSIKKYPLWKRPIIMLEWFTLPIATLFMAALPGIHAQTKLMLGKYMEYKVTEKV